MSVVLTGRRNAIKFLANGLVVQSGTNANTKYPIPFVLQNAKVTRSSRKSRGWLNRQALR